MKRLPFSIFLRWNDFLPCLIFAAATVGAAPGDLDTSFARTGKLRFGFGGGPDYGHAAAVQADGKLVMAGYSQVGNGIPVFSVVRFDTNNVLDASFGLDGKVITSVDLEPPQYSYFGVEANAVQVQADGKIVVAGSAHNGTTNTDFTLVRYNPDGSLDTTFGTNGTGVVYTDFGQESVLNATVIQSDGKIVAAGYIGVNNEGPVGFALARYQTNGALDASFGSGGTVTTPSANTYTAANAMAIEGDGKYVVVGTGIALGDSGVDMAVFRYTTNGLLDTTFGGGTGQVFTRIGANNYENQAAATAVAIQAAGISIQNPAKIVVAGHYDNFSSNYSTFAAARYALDGSLDTGFGNGGVVTNSISSGYDYAQGIAIQGGFGLQPRKFTLGGWSRSAVYGGSGSFEMARFTDSGSLDTTFGPGGTGKATLSFAPGIDAEAYAMVFQSGKFVLAGYEGVSGYNYDFAAARFNSDGSVDTNFGTGGVVTADITDLGSQAQGMAIQPDGKIVVAGSANNSTNNTFALARFNPDGSFDNSFGSYGKQTTILTPYIRSAGDQASAVAIQSDGKIVAAGDSSDGTNDYFAVVRYYTNGTLDASFGQSGKATTLVASGGPAKAAAIQSDGKILLGGYAMSGQYNVFALARFEPNGVLDTSFGGIGKVTTAFAPTPSVDVAFALALQPDGKIVLAGWTEYVNGGTIAADFALVRYNTNGSVDLSFGSLGRARASFASGTIDTGNAMAIQPDGKIVMAGGVAFGQLQGNYVGLARFQTNGTLDPSFGNNGLVVTEVGYSSDYATALFLQPGGKILVAGASVQGTNYQYLALRYNPDGSLDNSYGMGGVALVSFADGGDDIGNAMAFDSIGRVVIAGSANNMFGVTRLDGDPFLKFLSIARLPTGHVQLTGLGVPNASHTLRSSTNLLHGGFGPIGSVIPDATGFWQYDDGTAVGLNRQFYRLSLP